MKGIGFDATCSLAVANINTGKPVSVSPDSWQKGSEGNVQGDGGHVWDVILWAGKSEVAVGLGFVLDDADADLILLF